MDIATRTVRVLVATFFLEGEIGNVATTVQYLMFTNKVKPETGNVATIALVATKKQEKEKFHHITVQYEYP